jgi:hypothetical protein
VSFAQQTPPEAISVEGKQQNIRGDAASSIFVWLANVCLTIAGQHRLEKSRLINTPKRPCGFGKTGFSAATARTDTEGHVDP